MRQRSAKMASVYRNERVPLVKQMLEENPNCELFIRIRRVDRHCRDVHRGRPRAEEAESSHPLRRGGAGSRADAVATGPDKRIDDRRRKPREKELAE